MTDCIISSRTKIFSVSCAGFVVRILATKDEYEPVKVPSTVFTGIVLHRIHSWLTYLPTPNRNEITKIYGSAMQQFHMPMA